MSQLHHIAGILGSPSSRNPIKVITYNAVASACATAGRWEAALSILEVGAGTDWGGQTDRTSISPLHMAMNLFGVRSLLFRLCSAS